MEHEPVAEHASSSADLVYGVNAAGKIVHISEVPSGLACHCQCPSCGKPLVAKKGRTLAHHFAHDAAASCNSAPETALHRLAKQIIEDHLVLQVPDVKAHFSGKSRVLHKTKEVKFDRAVSEARHLNAVVPDLFVERDGRRLLIEIFVTHACDDIKRVELRKEGIATLEIDLSRTARDSSRHEVERAVLKEAPRHWVFHPQIDAAVDEMKATAENEKRAAAESFEKQVADLEQEYLKGLREIAARPPLIIKQNDEVFRAGLGEAIGIEIGGTGCFGVTVREWQFSILKHAFLPKDDHPRSYTVKALFDWFKTRKLVRPKFQYVSPEMEKALESKSIGFLSPYHAIEAFLDVLVERGLLQKARSYFLAPTIMEKISAYRATDARKERTTKDTIERVDKILSVLPEAERGSLTAAEWLLISQEWGVSFQTAIQNDDNRLDPMLASLRAIEAMMLRKGVIVEEMLGLPLNAALSRQRLARKEEADAREAARLEALNKAKEERCARLTTAAAALGGDAVAWINTVHPKLGKRPIEMAQSGSNELSLVLRHLDDDVDMLLVRQKRDNEIRALRYELEQEATKILGVFGKPFLGSPYPELGRKRPLDYCVSKATLKECLELAKKVKPRRR